MKKKVVTVKLELRLEYEDDELEELGIDNDDESA